MKIYIVQKGDTLQAIAQKHGISLSDLKKSNASLNEFDQVMPGMKMKIPSESKLVRRKGIQKKVEVHSRVEEPITPSEYTEEEGSQLEVNANTYTYKTDPYKPPSGPIQNGEYEIPFSEEEDGENMKKLPTIDDPFPDVMKEKEASEPEGVPQEEVSPYPQYGQTQPGAPSPYYGYPTYTPPYTGAPYSGEQGVPGYQGAPNPTGYYGYATNGGQQSYAPYRNPLGCRVESAEGYEAYPYYQNLVSHEEQGSSYSEMHPPQTGYPYYNYGYDAPEEGPVEGYSEVPNVPMPPETPYASYPYTQQEEEPAENEWQEQAKTGGYYAYSPNYQTGLPGGYEPYPQSTNNEWTYSNQQPYNPYSAYGTYPGATGPDYAMWESYVDYHQPPYQPDFPVKQERKDPNQ